MHLHTASVKSCEPPGGLEPPVEDVEWRLDEVEVEAAERFAELFVRYHDRQEQPHAGGIVAAVIKHQSRLETSMNKCARVVEAGHLLHAEEVLGHLDAVADEVLAADPPRRPIWVKMPTGRGPGQSC